MGDPRGFIKISRKESGNRLLHDRLNDYSEVEQTLNEEDRRATGRQMHGLWYTILPVGMPGYE
jgi:hypothetical protein